MQSKGAMSIPYVNASAVAAVIGSHPYQDANAAFLDVLAYAPEWRDVVDEVKAELKRCTAREAFAASTKAAPALVAAIDEGVAAASAATCDASVKAAIDAAVAAGLASTPDAPPAKRALLEAGIVQAVQMARGTALEAKALDTYEKDKRTTVSHRNAKMVYLRTPHYVIGGRIDGYDATKRCVLEVKNRKRAWTTPPSYDLVQLRVYLKMLNAKEGSTDISGVLVERFPDGTTRETPMVHDEAEWAPIHDALVRVKTRLDGLTRDEIVRIIQEQCVSTCV
jgi:hypothetical protein